MNSTGDEGASGRAEGRYTLVGAPASPFSIKMRALLRYRRIPHSWVIQTFELKERMALVRPTMIPKLRYPGEDAWHHDSTLLAYELERRHGDRSALPGCPALALVAHILEDMADEWGTKMMSFYRWRPKVAGGDPDFVSRVIVYPALGYSDDAELDARAREFQDFQSSHLHIPGVTTETAPFIERTFEVTLDAFEDLLRESSFLFGSRPSTADFAFFGQLHLCAINPASLRLMRGRAPRLYSWLELADDASGVEGQWIDDRAALPAGTLALAALAGEVYLPYLRANSQALAAGAERFEIEALGGLSFSQAPNKYHASCLTQIMAHFTALRDADRRRAGALLEGTRCMEQLLAQEESTDD